MKCVDARPLLDLLCDSALEAKDSALVLDHLKNCGECQCEWQALEDVRNQFQQNRDATQIPAGLMERISGKLKEEESHRQKLFFNSYGSKLAAVAIIVLLVIAGAMLNRSSSGAIASAALIDNFAQNSGLQPIADRSQLARRLGFQPIFLRLSAWHLQQSGLYEPNRTAAPTRIARFDFERAGQRLTCYQAQQGVIQRPAARSQDIGGKRVFFGSRGGVQFALWSQNGRDYLFVTQLPAEQLEAIVRGA